MVGDAVDFRNLNSVTSSRDAKLSDIQWSDAKFAIATMKFRLRYCHAHCDATLRTATLL